MSETAALHERLIALQSDDELERKWKKARGRWSNRYWAAEWLDVANRRGERLADFFRDLEAKQECLDQEVERAIHENRWKLYSR